TSAAAGCWSRWGAAAARRERRRACGFAETCAWSATTADCRSWTPGVSGWSAASACPCACADATDDRPGRGGAENDREDREGRLGEPSLPDAEDDLGGQLVEALVG